MAAPQLTTVSISSENVVKYPDHVIDVVVDNDLTTNSTINVPGTFFPYIIEFTGYPAAEGKRYISEWLFNKLSKDYGTNIGRVLSTLKRDVSPIPYYTLDYNLFKKKVADIRAEQIQVKTEAGEILINELEYLGSAIGNFEDVTPEYLLKWLDFPIKEGDGAPVEKFPILLDYKSSPVINVELVVIGHPISSDFFQNEYLVEITHDVTLPVIVFSADSYNAVLGLYNFATGEYSRPVTYLKIERASQSQTLDKMLSTALNPNIKSLLPNTNLAATATSVMNKLNQLKTLSSLPKLPKIPRVSLSKFIVDARVKFTAKKNIKRVKKSDAFNFSLASKVPKLPTTLSAGASKLKGVSNLTSLYQGKLASAQTQLSAITKKMSSIGTV